MLISGEPGIGKSRLTAALAGAAQASRTPACAISARRITRTARSIPIIAQLERAAGFERDDRPEAKLDKLAALLAPAAAPDGDVALLAELLSLPTEDRSRLSN